MIWDEYVLKYQPETREQAFYEGVAIGFAKAVELLRNPDRDEFSAGITACIHSHEWATWLESKKNKISCK